MPHSLDPFAPVDLTIEYVDSVAGSQKTRNAVKTALTAARRQGVRTIFSMPTLDLVKEMVTYAREDTRVTVVEITSRDGGEVASRICKHITSKRAQMGHLLFITHEGLLRIADWPVETAGFELYIDEVVEVVLNRKPFKLRDSHWVLTSFLDTVPVPATIAERNRKRKGPGEFTYPTPGSKKKTDQDRLDTCNMVVFANSNASPAEVEMAKKEITRLETKRQKWEEFLSQGHTTADRDAASSYYLIVPKQSNTKDPLYWFKRRETAKQTDDIYEYLDPIAKWLIQGNAIFTDASAWNRTTIPSKDPKSYNDYRRGLITFTGFRRPDLLTAFSRVTVMSALFQYTMLHNVWTQLGVTFVPSTTVTVAEKTTTLGKRRLNIYWLSDEGWSKRARDRSGGITPILQLIRDSGVINLNKKVCVVVNKDDGSEKDSGKVTEVFTNGIVMPNNVRGQNRWRDHHQLIHCSALNSYTSDIRWIESVLGIDSAVQRIGRTGQEVYQALMRLSLREPTKRSDITLVVMDKDVAEWLVQWFSPSDQVTVSQIDASGVIKKRGKTGRPIIGDKKMTHAERQRRYRLKHSADA